tara:strand:- start:6964 stop:7179 length:216 start_codon:yes stop_codon:yes gene_type:complete
MIIDDQDVVTVKPVAKKRHNNNVVKKTFFKLALTEDELEQLDTIVSENSFVNRTNYLHLIIRAELERYRSL